MSRSYKRYPATPMFNSNPSVNHDNMSTWTNGALAKSINDNLDSVPARFRNLRAGQTLFFVSPNRAALVNSDVPLVEIFSHLVLSRPYFRQSDIAITPPIIGFETKGEVHVSGFNECGTPGRIWCSFASLGMLKGANVLRGQYNRTFAFTSRRKAEAFAKHLENHASALAQDIWDEKLDYEFDMAGEHDVEREELYGYIKGDHAKLLPKYQEAIELIDIDDLPGWIN